MVELGRCQKMVSGEGQRGEFNRHRCTRGAVVVRDGRAYCKVHDPEYRQAKANASMAKSRVKWQKELAERHFAVTATNQCRQVNPNNPLAVAESIKDMYEALKAYQQTNGLHNDADSALFDQAEKTLAKAKQP